jgi:membrane-associated phospholipid phosphatase
MAGLYIEKRSPHRSSSRAGMRMWLLAYAAAAAALVGILSLKVIYQEGAPLGPDAAAARWTEGCRGPVLTVAARILNVAGRFYCLAPVGALAALCAWALRERRAAVGAIVAMAGTGLWIELLKWVIARPRPDPARWLVEESGGSFPSGHAATAMAVCLLLIAFDRRYLTSGPGRYVRAAILVLAPIAIGASRIYLGVHHLTDVLAGWFLGAAWFSLCWWWVRVGEK